MTTTFKIVRKSSTNEWIVRMYVNGKLVPEADYFTDMKDDATDTMRAMLMAVRAQRAFMAK